MSEILAGAGLVEFFATGFAHTARRWETRSRYQLDGVPAELAALLGGSPAPPEEPSTHAPTEESSGARRELRTAPRAETIHADSGMGLVPAGPGAEAAAPAAGRTVPEVDPWRRRLTSLRRQGRTVSRLRVVDAPPSAAQLRLLARAPGDVRAGEEIRCLGRLAARQLGVPLRDFWLFDAHTVGFLRFDGDRPLGLELTEAPDAAAVARRVWEAATAASRPVAEFAAESAPTADALRTPLAGPAGRSA